MSEQNITREMLKALDTDNTEMMQKMSKAELIDHLCAAVNFLNAQPERGPGRKDDVLALLQTGPHGILEIAEKLGINSKNVSSQLSYLRKDGYIIHTDERSRKYLAAAEPVKSEPAEETDDAPEA
jgi:Predicted transcriptional regulator